MTVSAEAMEALLHRNEVPVLGVRVAAAPLNTLASSAVQEFSVMAINTFGAVAPVEIALFFNTKVMYLVAPSAT